MNLVYQTNRLSEQDDEFRKPPTPLQDVTTARRAFLIRFIGIIVRGALLGLILVKVGI